MMLVSTNEKIKFIYSLQTIKEDVKGKHKHKTYKKKKNEKKRKEKEETLDIRNNGKHK